MKAIGKYQLIEEIGAGTAGITYRARDTFRNREVALKVIHPGLITGEEWKERFCRELGVCADLRHGHLTNLLEVGEADDAVFVATELLNGVDLRCHLQERRILPLEEKLEFIAQVLDGLAFAHWKGIAHGNIKPSNLFVVAGKDAKILDLGLAKCLAPVPLTDDQQPALVSKYLAPEQVLGQPFDARSDLYSVAVVLYELLAEKYPFEAAGDLQREIVHSEPEPLRKLDPKVPEEVERLVMHALRKDPLKRIATAEEFAAGLNAVAQKVRDGESGLPVAIPAGPQQVSPEPELITLPEPPRPPAAPRPGLQAVPAPPAEAPLPWHPAAVDLDAEPAVAPATPPPAAVPVAPRPPKPASAPAPAASAAPASKPSTPWLVARQKSSSQVSKLMRSRKQAVYIAIAALIAICVVGTFESRQRLGASQSAAETKTAVPDAKDTAQPAIPDAAPAEAPAPPPAAPAPQEPPAPPVASTAAAPPPPVSHVSSPEQVLRARVRPLWESGKYVQALGLVNEVLVDHPDNAEALAWKKKIRAAQEAEAAIK